MSLPRLSEIDQAVVMTVLIIFFGLVYLILFHEEDPLRCPAEQSREEAIERGCPVLKEDVRAQIMRT